MMRAYALGSLTEGDRDYPRAAAHVESCDACRRYVRGLRGLAAILPPFGLPLGSIGAGHGTGGVLAYLKEIFREGGQAASAGGASGVAGGVGGGTIASSMGTGAVIKSVAVAAGIAAAGLAASGHISGHHVQRHVAPPTRRAPGPPSASVRTGSTLDARPTKIVQGDRSSSYAAHRVASISPQSQVSREFGIEGSRQTVSRHATRTQEFASVASQRYTAGTQAAVSSQNSAPTAPSASVRREFGFEH